MAGSVLISAMIFLTTHKHIQDPTSGMRLFDKTMIPLFANELDFGPEPDTISLLMRWGYKVEEMQGRNAASVLLVKVTLISRNLLRTCCV